MNIYLLFFELLIRSLCIKKFWKLFLDSVNYHIYAIEFLAQMLPICFNIVVFNVIFTNQRINHPIKLIILDLNRFFFFNVFRLNFVKDLPLLNRILLYRVNLIVSIFAKDIFIRVIICLLTLDVSLKVFDIGSSELLILSDNVTHSIVVDLVLLYQLMHGQLVDVIVVNYRNSMLMSNSFVSFLVSLSFRDFLYVCLKYDLDTIAIFSFILFHLIITL